MIDLSGITLPFDIYDFISAGNGLIGLVGGFISLSLGFIVAIKIRDLIRGVLDNYKKASVASDFLKSIGESGHTRREKVRLAYSVHRQIQRDRRRYGDWLNIIPPE